MIAYLVELVMWPKFETLALSKQSFSTRQHNNLVAYYKILIVIWPSLNHLSAIRCHVIFMFMVMWLKLKSIVYLIYAIRCHMTFQHES